MDHLGSACSGGMALADLFMGRSYKLFTCLKYLGALFFKAALISGRKDGSS